MTNRPRGRPRGFDIDEALQAAGERFRASGFDGTSLDELSAATGLARPSLYAAFGDKRALYLRALERTVADVDAAFAWLPAERLGLRGTLQAILGHAIDGYLAGEAGPSGCIAVSTAATVAVEDAAIRETLAAFLAMQDRRIAEALAAAGDPDADVHALSVAAMLHSLSVRARAGATREALTITARACIDAIAPSSET